MLKVLILKVNTAVLWLVHIQTHTGYYSFNFSFVACHSRLFYFIILGNVSKNTNVEL